MVGSLCPAAALAPSLPLQVSQSHKPVDVCNHTYVTALLPWEVSWCMRHLISLAYTHTTGAFLAYTVYWEEQYNVRTYV